MAKVPPPDFAESLAEANHGRVNAALTERYGELIKLITDRASEFGTEWDGSMTVKIKMTADKYGGVSFKVTSTETVEAIPLPGAKMYYDPDSGAMTNEEPRQIKMPGFDNGGASARKVKAADAPKTRTEE